MGDGISFSGCGISEQQRHLTEQLSHQFHARAAGFHEVEEEKEEGEARDDLPLCSSLLSPSQESSKTLNAHSNDRWQKDENGKRKWVTTIDRPDAQVGKAGTGSYQQGGYSDEHGHGDRDYPQYPGSGGGGGLHRRNHRLLLRARGGASDKQMRSKALKVMQRLVNGVLVSTFERWRDHIHRGEAVQEEGFESDAEGEDS